MFVGFDNYGVVCMAPRWILDKGQVYRALTSVFFHGSVLHIAFNLMAFTPMGSSLERTLGTVQFFYVVLLFALLAAVGRCRLTSG